MTQKKAKKQRNAVLVEVREALGLSPSEFGEALGITRQQVWNAENGEWGLGSKRILRLVDLYRTELNRLGITAEDLLRGCRARPAA